MNIYADVVLYDSIGTPYNGSTIKNIGMGASESQAIILLEELSKSGKKCICINKGGDGLIYENVLYLNENSIDLKEVYCSNLIVHRTSNIPRINHKNLLIWITDNISSNNLKHFEILNKKQASLVCLSQYSANQFPDSFKKHIIDFIVPDWIYKMAAPSKEGRQNYLYASAAMKGLGETLNFWQYAKNNNKITGSLNVCYPGYDKILKNDLDSFSDVNLLNSLKLSDVITLMRKNKSLFYVNTMPETFCFTAILAAICGCEPRILCLNDFGALKENINSNLITKDPDIFISGSCDFSVKSFKSSRVIEEWRKILA